MFDDFDGGGGTVRHVAALPCSDGSPDGDGRRTASDGRIVALPLQRASDKLLHNHNDSGAALIPHHSQRVAASTADNNRTPLLPTVAEMVHDAIHKTDFLGDLTDDPRDLEANVATSIDAVVDFWEERHGDATVPMELIQLARAELLYEAHDMLLDREQAAYDALRDAQEAGDLDAAGDFIPYPRSY